MKRGIIKRNAPLLALACLAAWMAAGGASGCRSTPDKPTDGATNGWGIIPWESTK